MRTLTLPLLLFLCLPGLTARAREARLPSGKALRALVERYLEANVVQRAALRKEADATYGALSAADASKLAKALLKAAQRTGPVIGGSGKNHFYEGERGKYLVQGKPSKTLFLGLHGGGKGSGDAESAAGAMGGGGWWWIFPEVLDKTERGWISPPEGDLPGTERFVMDLIDAAKRTGKVDPNRIYLCGHSMGGFGTWHLGAHHVDVFAGLGAFAGAPIPYWDNDTDRNVTGVEEGVLPNLYAIRLHVYQSLDDPNVPPAENQAAIRFLRAWKERFPDGFDFRYDEVGPSRGERRARGPGGRRERLRDHRARGRRGPHGPLRARRSPAVRSRRRGRGPCERGGALPRRRRAASLDAPDDAAALRRAPALRRARGSMIPRVRRRASAVRGP